MPIDRFLGAVSSSLGIAELAAASSVARAVGIGVSPRATLAIRVAGARELAMPDRWFGRQEDAKRMEFVGALGGGRPEHGGLDRSRDGRPVA